MAETSEVEKGMTIFLDVFRRADKKDDGKISWEEFVSFFADGVMGKEELRRLFEEIDTHKTNYIDPRELCDYFKAHLGPFREILSLIEDLNVKTSNLLLSTSQTYPTSSRTDQFVTRFLTGLVMNQVCALQAPLDNATEALENIAKNDGSGIVPVQADDVKEKSKEGAIIPGRVVRRAKRQTSSQTSYEGGAALGGTKVALESQVERLTSLIDRLEKRVNFDGVVDEEVDVEEDQKVYLSELEVMVKSGEEQAFREAVRSYIESTNAAPGCLSVIVRSYKGTSQFTLYEVWNSEPLRNTYQQTDAGRGFKQKLDTVVEPGSVCRAINIPATWWKRD